MEIGSGTEKLLTIVYRFLRIRKVSQRLSRFHHSISAAIQALKRKKRHEKQLQQIDGTLSTIEMQRVALEEANTNTSVITTMKNAADALKNAHQHMYAERFRIHFFLLLNWLLSTPPPIGMSIKCTI